MPNNPKNDLSGKKFNRLIVIKYAGNGKWECACDCGKIVNIATNNLTSGNTKSCGCLNLENIRRRKRNFVDYSGKEYEGFKVIQYVESNQNGTIWECQCSLCGRKFLTNAANFNTYKSCGCMEAKNRKENVAKLMEKVKQTKTHPNILRKEANTNSKTGIRGVCYLSKTGTYVASIKFRGKQYTLKRSKDINECIQARQKAEKIVREIAQAYFEDFDDFKKMLKSVNQENK